MPRRLYLVVMQCDCDGDEIVRTDFIGRLSQEFPWSFELFRDVFAVLADEYAEAEDVISEISLCLHKANRTFQAEAATAPQHRIDGTDDRVRRMRCNINNILACELGAHATMFSNSESRRCLSALIERRDQAQD